MRAGSRPSFLDAIVLLGLVAGSSCRDDAAAPDAMGTTGSTSDPGSSTTSGSTADPDTTAGVGTETGVGGCVDDADCERGFVCDSVCVEVTAGSVSKEIGPEGGSLRVVGAGLEVPPGALREPTVLTLTRTDDGPPPSYAPVGALFQLDPPGLRFGEPAELWLAEEQPWPVEPRLYSSAEGGSGYEPLRTTQDGTYLEAPVWHFSEFFAGETFPALYYLGYAEPRIGADCNAPQEVGAFTRSWVLRVDDLPEGFEVARLENDAGGIWVPGDTCNLAANWPLLVEPGPHRSTLLYAAPYPGDSPALDSAFTLTLVSTTSGISAQSEPLVTIVLPCWRSVSLSSEAPYITTSRLDVCGCFDAVFGGDSVCVDESDAQVSCGPAWDWTNNGINSNCDLGGLEGQEHLGRDLMQRAIALVPERLDEESAQACAVLEQARQVCVDLASDPQGDHRSCHPGAEVNCTRHEPNFSQILDNAGINVAVEVVTTSASYCTGQAPPTCSDPTACGYALDRPAEAIEWTCEESDVGELQAFIQAQPNRTLLGWPTWSVGEAESNLCRMTKALVECVLPNLGGLTDESCELDELTGQEFAEFPGYCFNIEQRTGGVGAHMAGRAIDFNVATNRGNLAGCDLSCAPDQRCWDGEDGYLCTNSNQVAITDLPPRFVSIMEACGFTWGGRWGDPSLAKLAEDRHLGCDPMHFELPAP